MALTKEARDALPEEHFAVPGKRQLPIQDETHTRLAWDMVDRTKGLTPGERKAARSHILRRAKELGMDTKGWTIKALDISAMALSVPNTPDHPNKMPFSGILVRLDEPSDGAPHGAMGCKILLPEAAAAAALPSLLGMAVNYQGAQLVGHDPQAKIGLITEATIEEGAIHISGFFYASDFPAVTTQIKAEKQLLGFSFEAENIHLESAETDPLVIKSLTFTGAAVLQKAKAAYQTTRIAAHADDPNQSTNGDFTVTESEKILAAIGDISDRLAKVESGETARLAAASVADKVQKHADALHQCADKMAAAGIGMHPTRGHVQVLHHMADSLMAEAHNGNMAAAYSGPSMYSSAVVEPTKPVVVDPEVAALKASVADLTTKLADVSARRAAETPAPERRTVPAQIMKLLAKEGLEVPEAGKTLEISAVDNALKGIPDPQKRMEIKAGLRNAGVLAA
jgi:hypothetical protein